MAIKYANAIPEISNKKKMTKEELSKNIKKSRARDAELVTGKVRNLENPGCKIRFGYKWYPGDDFTFYELEDNSVVRIPRGAARHLNVNCSYIEYKDLANPLDVNMKGAVPTTNIHKGGGMQSKEKVQRFLFQSMEYMDDDWDMEPSKIIEVEINPTSILTQGLPSKSDGVRG
jgi:hypothetical protein